MITNQKKKQTSTAKMSKSLPVNALECHYYTSAQKFYDLAEKFDDSDKFLDFLFEKAIGNLKKVPFWLFAYFLDRKAMLTGVYWPGSKQFLTYLKHFHDYGNGDLSYIPRKVMAEVLSDILWQCLPMSVCVGKDDKESRSFNFKKIQWLLLHCGSDFWEIDTHWHSNSLGELEKVCTGVSLFSEVCEEERSVAIISETTTRILQEYEDYNANPIGYRNRFSGLIEFIFGTCALNLPVFISVEIGEWLYAVNDDFVAPTKRPRAWAMSQFVKRALLFYDANGHKTIALRTRADRQSDLRSKRAQRRARICH